MSNGKFIAVHLPKDAQPSAADVEQLTAACEAVADLRFDLDPLSREIEQDLTARGWQLHARLTWVVEARRGHEVEQASGRSRAEALAQLAQLVHLEEVPHLP